MRIDFFTLLFFSVCFFYFFSVFLLVFSPKKRGKERPESLRRRRTHYSFAPLSILHTSEREDLTTVIAVLSLRRIIIINETYPVKRPRASSDVY